MAHNTGPYPYSDAVRKHARDFVRSPLPQTFTSLEYRALRPFFSNLYGRVFFFTGLPENVVAALLAMYSRMKNPRGLRGVFVDTFLLGCLAEDLEEVANEHDGSAQRFLKAHKLDSLDKFWDHSEETRRAFETFAAGMATDPEFVAQFAASRKVRTFLSMWLDKYGHNSIARTGIVHVCFEGISLLAAKAIEWTRPAAGYIELSTRYVDMSGSACYPIFEEIAAGWGIHLSSTIEPAFAAYRSMIGDGTNGVLPDFLREQYHSVVPASSLEAGVFGEACDIGGNFLPLATLTSVGVGISGESFPGIARQLILEDTPETVALADLLIEEAGNSPGAAQFLRHYQPTPWEWRHRQYLDHERFPPNMPTPWTGVISGLSRSEIERTLEAQLFRQVGHQPVQNRNQTNSSYVFEELLENNGFFDEGMRGQYDKLPPFFESCAVTFDGVMSMRGWRDLHRMSFCSHQRTLVTPRLGFYRPDKPMPVELIAAFAHQEEHARASWQQGSSFAVPHVVLQYLLPCGFLVGFTATANLRQWEFCGFQRTSWTVNHEVRKVFCGFERQLRSALPWWDRLSRADMTPAYVFARGKEPTILI